MVDFRQLLGWRLPPVNDTRALADFIDAQAAFLVQKGIYEYARARAGHYSKVLFSEQEFQAALDRSRFAAYPLGLAMVGEVVEGVLRPQAADSGRQLEALSALVLAVFDRCPRPAQIDSQAWSDARADLARRLQLIGLHAPKPVKDIPEPYAEAYWDLMPIKKEVRSADFPTTRSYLMITLCNIHDELSKRLDKPALIASLLSADKQETTAH